MIEFVVQEGLGTGLSTEVFDEFSCIQPKIGAKNDTHSS